MKHIKTYQIFESEKELTPEQEAFLNECTQGRWEFDSSTGLVNVDGDFVCKKMGLEDLKGIRFGRVVGDFSCHNNHLESLTGAPQQVGGHFSCNYNSLKSLVGAPQEVGGYFYCSHNSLKSLEGAPQVMEGDFYCNNNHLESLTGAPQVVGGSFNCSDNNLTTLDGAPQQVGGYFSCNYNNLTSLAGAPQTVGGNFECHDNNLASLAGAPQVVGGDFRCDAFSLGKVWWNPKGWMKIFKSGKPEAQNLIMTLLGPEILNREIQKDPQRMLQMLKGVWDAEGFADVQKELKFPDEYVDVGKTIRSLQKLDDIKGFI